MRRLLIVSPHFPPVNAPDMHRAVGALPYLRDLGWEATVLCVDARDVAAPRDDRLASLVPADVRVERCRAWPLSLTRLAGMRTLSWRSWLSLRRAGRRLIRETRPEIILFTTTQYPVVSLGPRWKREFSVPYVVDLQDPWLTDYYSRAGSPAPPGGWKYAFARAIAARMEPAAFMPASGFVSVSPDYLLALAARYPWFSGKPQATIPFGVDERESGNAAATERAAFEREPDKVHLVSVGAAGPIMAGALAALFAQLRDLRAASPGLAASLRLHFIGTSYAPEGLAQPSVKPAAAAHGVGDLVSESTGRVPWHVAQATLHAADGIIVLASDEPGYTPSKIAGSFLARRPCLVVASPGSGAARMSADLGLGAQLDPSGSTPGALGDFVADIGRPSPLWPARRNEGRFTETYTASARTRQLAEFLGGLSAGSA
jgi:hypothetical protein